MPRIPNDVRDLAITRFRTRLFDYWDFIPFAHQAEWMLASDGVILTPEQDPSGVSIRLPDGSVERFGTVPRPAGRAKVLADLGAFKTGKSKGGGMWAASFACIPDARVSLVGLEYDICAPEFEYICQALLSERSGKPPLMRAKSIQNRPRDGRMWLDLENGARFEAKSWERKDTLKGKEIDAYLYCEAFMLPGLECYTGVKQNLAARNGYALFATTPDRPWVQELHDRAHGADPDYLNWHCTCSVPRSINPYTFDALEMSQATGIMSAEQFAIAYLGRLGDYVGRCYNYQKHDPSYVFTPASHPELWKDPDGQIALSNLNIPEGWEVLGAADTGTFMAGLIATMSPDGDMFILYEQPNYKYINVKPDLDKQSSIPSWAEDFKAALLATRCTQVWADRNSQFKSELRNHHDIILLPAASNLQTRTEVGREYVQNRRVWFAPWLRILPFEMENAQWPDESTAAGRFERLKVNDHTLDCFEHLAARRPHGRETRSYTPRSWAEQMGYRRKSRASNPHLGVG